MAYEQRDNSGSLFKNDKMREGKSDPQASGTAMIDGVEYWVSAWTKDGKEGRGKWQSLAFKRKDSKPEQEKSSDDLSDIPF